MAAAAKPKEVKTPFVIRSKIWIEDADGAVVFGLGRYRILSAVERLGSLNAAAKELKMSYRAAWGRIKATEARIGRPIVVREGKGSRLTAHAQLLMKQFRRLHALVESESDDVFAQLMEKPLMSKDKSG
jgi:molybdate transport system regulatory protein